MNEPKRITAGNSYTWTTTPSDYKPSDGWSLSYSLVNHLNHYSIESTVDGESFVVTLTTGDTENFIAGEYKLVCSVEQTDQRKTLSTNRISVRPNFAEAGDFRSYAEKTLEAIEAMFAKAASRDQMSIVVDGQTLARRSVPDLIMLRDRFKREVKTERRLKQARKAGRKPGRIAARLK